MKKLITIAACFIFSFSIIFGQVQSGTFFFDSSTPNYTLNNNNGSRSVEKEISFAKPFDSKPKINLTASLIDASENTQFRYSIEAKGASRDGFVIKITTWGDTKLNAIGGYWVAEAEKLEIKKEEIKVGQTFQLNNVFFNFNKWDLLPESYEELDKVVKMMNENPKVQIEVSGHTDNVGSDDYNMNLSQKRADAVKNYIVSKGIKETRIQSKGYGKTRPVASNKTDSGREQNRRVEFTIIKK